jgi:chemosensory pili system protein ChpA (sensor histidine kinase/response regulator)
MNFQHDIDFTTLSWIKSELDATLQQARIALEAYVENPADSAQMRECVNHLHLVHGTLRMVELYGAAMVVEEMERVAQGIADKSVAPSDDVYSALIRGIMQLPDYLERLQSGHKDIPIILLPLLNDLRAARSEKLLTESVLFTPDLGAPLPHKPAAPMQASELRGEVQRLRNTYQIALLQWIRDDAPEAQFGRMSEVLERLENVCNSDHTRRLWWVANGVLDGVRTGTIETTSAIKQMFGKLDREIKMLISQGEAAFDQAQSRDLTKNFLYYLAHSNVDSPRAKEIAKLYKLKTLLPSERELEHAQGSISGHNRALLDTVSAAIKDDLLRVKEALDIFLRGQNQDPAQLGAQGEALDRVADTLGMLGLGVSRKIVAEQRQIVGDIVERKRPADESSLLDVAGSLLYVEASLDDHISRLGGEPAPADTEGGFELPKAEVNRILDSLMREAAANLAQTKHDMVAFVEAPWDHAQVEQIPRLLEEVGGALDMLSLHDAAQLINGIVLFIEVELLQHRRVPNHDQMDTLADALASIEYYIEATREQRGGREHILDITRASLRALNYWPIPGIRGEQRAETPVGEVSVPVGTAAPAPAPVRAAPAPVAPKPAPAPAPKPAAHDMPDYDAINQGIDFTFSTDATHSFDDEIRDIFLEEVQEEITGLQTNVPKWRSNVEDFETLKTIRRSFHTLKGSSRLVGALALGEFSWKIENMLNRVLDKSIGTETAQGVLTHALEALPDLLEALKGGARPGVNIVEIKDVADRVAAGEDAWIDESKLRPRKALAAAPAEAVETPASIPAEQLPAHPAFGEGVPLLDPVLFDVLSSEVSTHLAVIDAFVDQARKAPIPVSEALLRATHTLNGAISMVDLPQLSQVLQPLEGYIKRLQVWEQAPDADGVAALADASTQVKATIAALESHTSQLPDTTELAARVLDLRNALPEPELLHSLLASEEEGAPAVHEPGAEEPAPAAHIVEPVDHDTLEPVEAEEFDAKYFDELIAAAAAAEATDAASHAQHPAAPETTAHEPVTHEPVAETPHAEIEAPSADMPHMEAAEPPAQVETTQVSQPEPSAEHIEHFDLPSFQVEQIERHEEAAPVAEELVAAEPVAETEHFEHTIEFESFAEHVEEPRTSEPAPVETFESAHPIEIEPVAEPAETPQAAEFEPVAEAPEPAVEAPPPVPAPATPATPWSGGHLMPADEAAIAAALAAFAPPPAEQPPVEKPYEPAPFETLAQEHLPVTEEMAAEAAHVDQAVHEEVARIAQQAHEAADEAAPPVHAEEAHAAPAYVEEIGALHPMPDIDPDLLEIFIQEAKEILDHADASMAKLRENPSDRELVTSLQRDLHTVKGGAHMSGIAPIGDLGHAMESLFEAVAEQRRDMTRPAIEALEQAFDRMHGMVQLVERNQPTAMPVGLIRRIEGLVSGEVVAPAPAVAAPIAAPVAAPAPAAEAAKPVRPAEPAAARPAEEEEARVQEYIRVRSDLLDNMVNTAGEVAIYRSRLEQQVAGFRYNLVELDATVARLREQLRKLELETEAQILSRYQRAEEAGLSTFDPLELDRFSTLQQLSRSLSESVSDLSSIQGTFDDLTRQSETLLLQQSRVNSDLQEGLMRTRMVPFESLVPALRRTLRQTAQELGRKAQLKVEGAQGEMDRNLLDRMKAPFEHMLRNALAHGIETPADRRAANKPEEGTVNIALAREATEVVLRVTDDGRGLNRDAIRRKAVEKGLLAVDAQVSDRDIFAYILDSGFSTAETVSHIAGRGVGMDVVHNEIKQLGGSLTIDSTPGKGAAFTVRLPFTLAVTQAILVRIGETAYAIPMSAVQGVARIGREDVEKRLAGDDPTYAYAGETYGIHELSGLLGVPASKNTDDTQVPLLMTRTGDQRAAVRVDAVTGSREIVVKSVGPQISSVPGILGATIMGDGSVVMILDLAPLLRRAAARRAQGEEHAVPVVPLPAVLQPKRRLLVMVVDDSITMRKATTRVLERQDMDVITAKDGLDAVEKLQDHIPDIVLLDVEMPRMDGYEFATYMKNDPRTRGVPIIMITSRTGEKHRQRAAEIGVERYLGKPYQEADLLHNIAEAVGHVR